MIPSTRAPERGRRFSDCFLPWARCLLWELALPGVGVISGGDWGVLSGLLCKMDPLWQKKCRREGGKRSPWLALIRWQMWQSRVASGLFTRNCTKLRKKNDKPGEAALHSRRAWWSPDVWLLWWRWWWFGCISRGWTVWLRWRRSALLLHFPWSS